MYHFHGQSLTVYSLMGWSLSLPLFGAWLLIVYYTALRFYPYTMLIFFSTFVTFTLDHISCLCCSISTFKIFQQFNTYCFPHITMRPNLITNPVHNNLLDNPKTTLLLCQQRPSYHWPGGLQYNLHDVQTDCPSNAKTST